MTYAAGDENGASSVEYGLIVFAIAALIAIAVFGFGGVVTEMFTSSCEEIANSASASSSC